MRRKGCKALISCCKGKLCNEKSQACRVGKKNSFVKMKIFLHGKVSSKYISSNNQSCIFPMSETLVIALHPDVAVDVKSHRVEFFDSFFRWNENCNRLHSENTSIESK